MSTATGTREFLRFITKQECQVETAHWGHHDWLCRPEMCDTKQLLFVRVKMPPGRGHQFHRHPAREEIIYVLDGKAQQWVDREKKILKAGESAFIPKDTVHGIYNTTSKPVTFLAILSPAVADGPFLIDCYHDEPWRSLRKPFEYK